MSDVQAEPGLFQIIFRNDDETPVEFVVDLLHSVFKTSAADTTRFLEKIDKYGQAICGTYPRERANKLLASARRRIRAAGHSLLITSEAIAEDGEMPDDHCKLCGTLCSEDRHALEGAVAQICDDCLYEISRTLPEVAATRRFESACDALAWHFAGIPHDQLVATARQFPGHMRADVQGAVDKLFSASPSRFFGIYERYRYETLTIAALTKRGRDPHAIAPAQYHDVDVGESAPVKCLDNGLWLCQAGELRYAVVLSSHREYALRDRDPYRDCRAGRRGRERIRATMLLRVGGCRQRSALLSRQDPVARRRRRLSRALQGSHGPPAAGGAARGRDPARSHAEIARPQCPELCRKPRAVAPAGTIDPQGHPALRAARNRQDPYHPLSRQQPARSHHPDHHRSADHIACPLHEPGPAAAAGDRRDRGCRSHCARSRRDGTLRGIDAQRAFSTKWTG